MVQHNVFGFVSVRPPQRVDDSTATAVFPRFSDTRRTPLHVAVAELQGEGARLRATALGREFMASERYVGHRRTRERALREVRAVRAHLMEADQPPDRVRLTRAIEAVVKQPLGEFVAGERFGDLKIRFWDSLYAYVLAGESSSDLDDITTGIRVLHLLESLADEEQGEPMSWVVLRTLRPLLPIDLVPASERRAAPPAPAPDGDGRGDGAAAGPPPEQGALLARSRIDRATADVTGAYRDNLAAPATGSGRWAAPGNRDPAPETPRAQAHPRRGRGERREAVLRREPAWRVHPGQLKEETVTVLRELGIDAATGTVPDIITALENEAGRITERLWSETVGLPGTGDGGAPVSGTARAMRASAAYVPAFDWALPAEYVATLESARQAPEDPKPYRLLGIGDLHVVQETLLRYEPNEVAHIENVLRSERRKRVHERLRETEETIVLEAERIDERERDLQTAERFELQRETQRTIESDTSVQAGATVSASYGFVDVTAYGNFAYEASRSESNRNASTFARDVTDRAVQRITERVREERIRRTLARITETNTHAFDNTEGPGHVRGVYQWVDKTYQAQVVNYGQRLMLEFIVPEPAAFYIFTQRNPILEDDGPRLPPEPVVPVFTTDRNDLPTYLRDAAGNVVTRPLTPADLIPGNYRFWVSAYGVQDVSPPPPEWSFIATSLTKERQGPSSGLQADEDWSAKKIEKGELTVPPGYRAVSGWVQASSVQPLNATSHNVLAIAGQHITGFSDQGEASFTIPGGGDGIDGTIPVTTRFNAPYYTVNVVIQCERTAEHFQQWQLDIYAAIMTAYRGLKQEYDEARRRRQRAGEIAGQNPARNRQIVRDELKKSCITLMTGERFETFDAVGDDPQSGYPEIDVEEATGEGTRIQFLEQAFEWNQMTYLFYPYFWGRKEHWRETFPLDDVDPAFADFLRAGAARVILPVHPAYNDAVALFLGSGGEILFGGADAPTLAGDLFVSIAAELRSRQGADVRQGPGTVDVVQGERTVTGHGTAFDPNHDVDRELSVDGAVYRIQAVRSATEIVLTEPYEGESRDRVLYGLGPRLVDLPWEVRVPTSLVYVNADSALPDWTAERRR